MPSLRTIRARRRRNRSTSVIEALETRALLANVTATAWVFADYDKDEPELEVEDDASSTAGPVVTSLSRNGSIAGQFAYATGSSSSADYGVLEVGGSIRLTDQQDGQSGLTEVRASSLAQWRDSLKIVPVASSLQGETLLFDVRLVVTGAPASVHAPDDLRASPGSGAQYTVSWDFPRPVTGGGSIRLDARAEDYGDSDSEDSNADWDRGLPRELVRTHSVVLAGPGPGGRYNVSVGARASTSASTKNNPAGTVLTASVPPITVTWGGLSNFRLEDGRVLTASDLRSVSDSGFDYLGTGEPPEEDEHERRWTGNVNSSFAEDGNWDPEERPRADDIAIFDDTDTYTVNVGSHTVERLIVQGGSTGDVTFRNANLVAQRLSESSQSVDIRDGKLSFNGINRLTSNHAIIGSRGPATVTVSDQVDWTNNGRLAVGGGGDGTLTVTEGGEVRIGSMRIGDDPNGQAFGTVRITGENAKVGPRDDSLSANILVGSSSRAAIIVENGAELSTGLLATLQIGSGSGAANGSLLVDGSNLDVGRGEGTAVLTDKLRVGADGGAGAVSITQGGSVVPAEAVLGNPDHTERKALVEVTGKNSANQEASTLDVTRTLKIGGHVTASDGGEISASGSVTVGNAAQAPDDAALLEVSGGKLQVLDLGLGGELEIAPDGDAGTLSLAGGSISADGTITIGPAGRLLVKGGSIDVGSEDEPGSVTNEGLIGVLDAASRVALLAGPIVNRGSGKLNVSNGELNAVLSHIELHDSSSVVIGESGAALFDDIVLYDEGASVKVEGQNARLLVSDIELAENTTMLAQSGGEIIATSLYMKPGSVVTIDALSRIALGDVDQTELGVIDVGPNGVLQAYGAIDSTDSDGYVDNGGTVIVGNSPGELIINGDYVQSADGVLIIEVGGTEAGTEYDQLIVNGDAIINGEVRIEFINGYIPGPEDTFDFLVSGSVEGAFSEITVTGLPAGMEADFEFSQEGIVLEVNGAPDPTAVCDGRSAGIGVDGTTLFVIGDDRPDRIDVKRRRNRMVVRTTSGTKSYRAADLTNVVVCAHGGSDRIDIHRNVALPAIIDGGDGADRIRGGSGSDFIHGGRGNDRIAGGDQDDTLIGGSGRDRLSGGRGNDLVDGEAGADYLNGNHGRDLVIGGHGRDTLSGGSGQDLLLSGTTTLHRLALGMVLNEWASSRRYGSRVANIRGDKDAGMNKTHYLSVTGDSRTVEDDGHHDVLRGHADRDWFFAARSDSVCRSSREELDLL